MHAPNLSQAILIPVHPPKVNWIIAFLNSVRLATQKLPDVAQPRIVLACTTHENSLFFSNILANFLDIAGVEILNVEAYIQGHLGSPRIKDAIGDREKNGVINIKKFIALHWAMENKIDLAVVIDSDVVCTKNADLSKFMAAAKRNYDTKTLHGAIIDDSRPESHWSHSINQASAAMLRVEHAAKLKADGLLGIYTWFMDPPTYTLKDLQGFFAYMTQTHGSLENFFLALTWYTFDYVVYGYYRAMELGTRIQSYNDIGVTVIPEILNLNMINMLRDHTGYAPVWLSCYAVFNEPALTAISYPDVALLYHFDRL